MTTKTLIKKKNLNYTGVLVLESYLPKEIIYNINDYLFESEYKNSFHICLSLIPLKVKNKLYSRCSLCEICEKVYTYNSLCNDCDNDKWDDMG